MQIDACWNMRYDTIWRISTVDTSPPINAIVRKEQIVKSNIILSDQEIIRMIKMVIKMVTSNTCKYDLICDELICDPHDEMEYNRWNIKRYLIITKFTLHMTLNFGAEYYQKKNKNKWLITWTIKIIIKI